MRKQFTSTVEVEAYLAGEKIQCLECGKWFALLGNHLRVAHELSVDEYRQLYALPAMTPLAGQAYRLAHREKIERLQATGALTYDHLPMATAKAASAAKPKIGVAKIEHAARVAELRPGDHNKLPPGAKRADGRDADHEREMQQLRRQAAPATPAGALPEVSHQERIKSAMERLVMGGTTKSPKLWICRQMEITMIELDSWLMDSSEPDAITPPRYAIKYMTSLVPNSGGRANRFTPDEDEYLKANFAGNGGAIRCANALNRQVSTIRFRARTLGLQKSRGTNSTWTDDHIAILRSHYTTDGAEYVAEKTGHTAASARTKATSLSIASARGRPRIAWTAEQDHALREHYSNGKIGGDVRKITGHSYAQCAQRAKELGILIDIEDAKKILAQLK